MSQKTRPRSVLVSFSLTAFIPGRTVQWTFNFCYVKDHGLTTVEIKYRCLDTTSTLLALDLLTALTYYGPIININQPYGTVRHPTLPKQVVSSILDCHFIPAFLLSNPLDLWEQSLLNLEDVFFLAATICKSFCTWTNMLRTPSRQIKSPHLGREFWTPRIWS